MRVKTVLLTLLLAGAVAAPAYAWDVYKYSQPEGNLVAVPDVDKVPNPPAPPPPAKPAPPDDTCWQASAANVLAAAGWGKAGNTPQQNATAIYGHMTSHFGYPNCGWGHIAINWWLINYGYNPNAPDLAFYNPNWTYSDVTYVTPGGLTAADYDFLLDELKRCQYVTVGWQHSQGGHEMALVGGNYSPWAQNPGPAENQKSVWHDSDRVTPAPGDDPHTNIWWGPQDATAAWRLDYQDDGIINNDWWAEEYTTLCPGLKKPQAPIENYDAAWYKDMDPDGNLVKKWRIAGAMGGQLGQPVWADDEIAITIYNEQMPPPWHKEVWLLVDYFDRDNNVDPGILLASASTGPIPATEIFYSDDDGQILFHWVLLDQPPWEKIIFPGINYKNLAGDVKDWDLAVICVPEPATLGLMGLGLVAMLIRRRR